VFKSPYFGPPALFLGFPRPNPVIEPMKGLRPARTPHQ
jgi:hypothetical protein